MAWAQIFLLLSAIDGSLDLSILSPARTAVVYGEAVERVAPDIATIQISVQSQGSLAESLAAEADDVAALVADLKRAGVAAQDVRTLGPTFQKVFKPNAPFSTNTTTVLSVVVHAMDRVAEVARAAGLHNGAIDNVRYDCAGRKAREDALRAAAIEDARHKAEIDAEAAGLKVIAAHSVVEESAGVFGNLARLQAQGPLLDNAANAGAIVLREGVFVSFDLGPK
jgi:hypothetical protein